MNALISGRVLRSALIVVTGLLFVTAATASGSRPSGVVIGVLVFFAIAAGLWPDGPAPIVACLAAVALLVTGGVAVNLWLAAMPTLLHATHLLAALASVVPASASVERAALVPSLRRFGLAQAIALPVLLATGQFLV